jgi:transglutaminase-like putative cysteine protease
VAMCRAVDVKVRFVTGLGYTGAEWGDHAWNQAYDADAGEWLSVDTTFGTSGVNYFDSAHFNLDHKDSIVQGEW